MTNYRKALLDKIAKEEGLETPMTIAIFRMSDLYPQSCHDNMIADLYTVLRSVENYVMKHDEELPLEEPEEDDCDHPDYDPYCGCDMPDIFDLEW